MKERWPRTSFFADGPVRLLAQKELSSCSQPKSHLSTTDLVAFYSIASVVDDLIDRVMVDPRLNANPLVDEAHHRVPAAGFKYLVTELVCSATGGPQTYSGKSMADSHRDLKITPTSGLHSWTIFSRRWIGSTCRPGSKPS